MGGIMVLDAAIGSIFYVFVSICFGRAFEGSFLALSIAFSLLPDADFVPYFVIKKVSARLLRNDLFGRFRGWLSSGEKLVTHHLVHFPLFFIVVALVFWKWSGNAYVAALFLVCSLGHLLHDTFTTPQGIQWFFPCPIGYRFSDGGIHRVGRSEREEIFNLRRQEYSARSLGVWGELRVRMEAMGTGTCVVALLAFMAVVGFAVFSQS